MTMSNCNRGCMHLRGTATSPLVIFNHKYNAAEFNPREVEQTQLEDLSEDECDNNSISLDSSQQGIPIRHSYTRNNFIRIIVGESANPFSLPDDC